MSIRRESKIEQALRTAIAGHPGADPEQMGPMDGPIAANGSLTRRQALRLFESMLQSRLQDLESRRMKDRGESYYTIGSSGHEANGVFGHLLRSTDPALLHYRSGAFLAARQRQADGQTPIFDSMLSFAASAEDPVSGGRHKVLGSSDLWVPPQTSTIASHLPKAVGMAYALARMSRLGIDCPIPEDSLIYCSFGDASANHATAQSGFTSAAAASLHRQPCPVLFVCEDNGIGISVRTPDDYIERSFRHRTGFTYFEADGRDLVQTYERARRAIAHCRSTSSPVFFHLRTLRLMGHAGSDVESTYLTERQLSLNESRDPMVAFAGLLLDTGAIDREGLLALYDDMQGRIERAGREAITRRRLESREEIIAPLQPPRQEQLDLQVAPAGVREKVFEGKLPEKDARPRHLAFRIAQALRDLLAAYPQAFVFGEDVARKGGVYHVTDGLHKAFGSGRVFNTILDETTILGLAQGMAQLGCLPFPEIQYLAYLHNAIDQIRGEAASLRFFSDGRLANPMVLRIAGYAYQKGFGGHFHNDNSIGALLEIPGLIIASPARPADAVQMLRTCAAAAHSQGAVCVFLEPIALYMTKDLHEKGDGLWQDPYPAPEQMATIGDARVYGEDEGRDLTIVSWANGLYMSLQAQRRLADAGVRARVLDLRWLAPLPMEQVRQHALATGRVLVVDECRATMAGPSSRILAELATGPRAAELRMQRVAGADSYVPLGQAANEVLVQVDDIVEAALALCAGVPK